MPHNETMTSRRRVIATLNREPVDRFPIDLGGHPSTGISAFAYRDLREHLGLPVGEITVYDTVQMLARVDTDVLDRFHVDMICLEPPWRNPARWTPRDPYQFLVPGDFNPRRNDDGEWVVTQGDQRMRMPDGGYFFDGDWLCIWDADDEDANIARYAAMAERIHKETDYAINYCGYSRGPDAPSFFRDINQAVDMLTDPDKVLEENERLLARSLRQAGKIIDALGPYIQLISTGNDLGMQSGPICRNEHFERFCLPFYKKYCDFIHANSDIKTFMHSCGSLKPLIPLLIEAGLDVLNPVQVSAADMDPHELKAEFGDRIIFWGGGCDTQNVLGVASPDRVAENVAELVNAFKPGGGFVFNQVHNIMGDVPPENIVAMLDTACDMSFYDKPTSACSYEARP